MKLCFVMPILLLWILIEVYSESQTDVIIKIQQGTLRGTTLLSERSNKTFFAFMGIPYAKPPVKELRFKSPQAAESWEGVRDATIEGSVCPQLSFGSGELSGEEDCLFLNVFTPMLPNADNFNLKPVIFVIHGGGFFIGSGNRAFAGPDYLIEEDVVVVTINYRLGALGFLSLNSKEVPGNAGLKDQALALRWVKENIKEFGGDPDKVTINGESAGGASVHYHILSPLSKGLFRHAISQSGSALNPWSFCTPDSNLKMAFSLRQALGIEGSDTNMLQEHLMSANVTQLLNVFRKMHTRGSLGFKIPFCPTVDTESKFGDVFLPDTPINLITSGKFHKVPYITGVTSHEGIIGLHAIIRTLNTSIDKTIEMEIIKDLELQVNAAELHEVTTKIKHLYFGSNKNNGPNATLLGYIDFVTDMDFFNGVYCTIKLQTALSTSPVYAYEFSYNGSMSVFKDMFGGTHLPGASHADDVAYLFTTGLSKARFPERKFEPHSSELETSKRLVKMWANFAKTGNPTPESEPLLKNVKWKPVTQAQFNYLSIDTELQLKHNLRKEHITTWQEIYKKYGSSAPSSGILKCWNFSEVKSFSASGSSKLLSPITISFYLLYEIFTRL